jgi:hypothetical protein
LDLSAQKKELDMQNRELEDKARSATKNADIIAKYFAAVSQ